MTRHGLILGSLGVMVGLGGLLAAFVASPETQPTLRREFDLPFAQVGDETLRLDLSLPTTSDGPFPVVLCLHGGGWVAGSRKQMTHTLEVLARRGYVACAPDYRLAPQHRWPACLHDCKAAVRWLRAHAGKYGLDPSRIGVVGLSAGGHLACLLGVTDPRDGLEGTGGNLDRSSAVQAVVSLSGPTDLTSAMLHSMEVRSRNLEPLLGGPPEAKADLYRQASPALYQPRTPPPFLLIHGGKDPIVPPSQATTFAEKLRQSGGQARVLLLEDQGHTWAGRALTKSIDQFLTFLDETLQK